MFMFALPVVVFCVAPPLADKPAPVSQVVDETLRPLVDSKKVVGMAVGIIDGDQTYVYGLGRVAANRAEVPNGKTVYEIGSVSKVFTTAILAQMLEAGDVTLDQPVAELLPSEVKVPVRDDAKITLRHLATHASGLPRIPSNLKPNLADPYRDYSEADLFGYLAKCELKTKPGETVAYSNLGMGLLGVALVHKADKASYEELVVDRITGPLAMSDTRVVLGESMQSRLAQGYNGLGLKVSNWEIVTLAGAGGLRSTADDMLKFARFALEPDGTGLGKGIRRAHAPERDMGSTGMKIGLAWVLLPDGTVFHNGQTGGYHAFLGLRPDRRVAVVVLCNSSTGAVDAPALDLLSKLAACADHSTSR